MLNCDSYMYDRTEHNFITLKALCIQHIENLQDIAYYGDQNIYLIVPITILNICLVFSLRYDFYIETAE